MTHVAGQVPQDTWGTIQQMELENMVSTWENKWISIPNSIQT